MPKTTKILRGLTTLFYLAATVAGLGTLVIVGMIFYLVKDLPRVVRFLERAAHVYLAADDVETLGEVGDALKIVGRGYGSKLLRKIVTRLIERDGEEAFYTGKWAQYGDLWNHAITTQTFSLWGGNTGSFAVAGSLDPGAQRRHVHHGVAGAARTDPRVRAR